jgi:chemotaxis protein CheY-P-specific phosphatase CheC
MSEEAKFVLEVQPIHTLVTKEQGLEILEHLRHNNPKVSFPMVTFETSKKFNKDAKLEEVKVTLQLGESMELATLFGMDEKDE